MKKKNARRPRKGALQDTVSCPPKINLHQSSLGVPKIQLSSLIGDIPENEEVNVAEFLAHVPSNNLDIEDQSNDELLGKEYEQKDHDSNSPPGSLSKMDDKSKLEYDDELILDNNVSSRSKHSSLPKEVIKKVDPYKSRQAKTQGAHYRGNRKQRNFSSGYRDVPNSSMISSLATWDSASMFSTGQTMFTRVAQRPSWGHYVVGLLVFLGWTLHHAYNENLNSYLNTVNNNANLGNSRVYDSSQYDRAQKHYDRSHQVRGSMASSSDYSVADAENVLAERLKTAAMD
mmetsp:Transcript_8424/g.12206  ORF Transcript_8424/g.12206 Transcript_8424/m.12206 type:complete len:287 (+) Transcript_8424:114-974(+)